MKIFYSFITLILLGGLLFPQSNQRVFEKMGKTKLDFDEKFQSSTHDKQVNDEIKRKPIDHVFIGKMWNAYSTQGSYTNQIFTDPYSGLTAVIHRGSREFPHSGVIVYQVSDDRGFNWSPQIGPMGSINFQGRHPNIAISNPAKSNSPVEQRICASFPALTTFWYYLVFVTDTAVGSQNYFTTFDSLYYPNDEMFINSKGWVFTAAPLIEPRIEGSDTIIIDLFYSTDGGFNWNKKPLVKKSDINYDYNGTKGFINNNGIGYIVINAKKPGQDFYTFGYKRTTDDGLTWDSTWTWVNPFNFPELQGKVHALNYEIDIVTDINNYLNFVGTFVDTITPGLNGNTGIYHIYGDGNTWKANLVSKVNVTHQILPGGLITLNECEIATSYNSGIIFIKWADKPQGEDKYDLFGTYAYYSLSGYYYWYPFSTNTPNINEKFSQMSSFLITNIGVQPALMYTIFGNNDSTDLGESELWFLIWPEPIIDVVEDEIMPVVDFRLSQNYPNPFNNKTRLQYYIPYEFNGNIEIKVFNLLGEEISTLVNEHKSPGYHYIDFDGSNLSSGVYIFQLKANQTVKKIKGILLK